MREYLDNNFREILEKLTLDLLNEKPKDILKFMEKWIQEKGP